MNLVLKTKRQNCKASQQLFGVFSHTLGYCSQQVQLSRVLAVSVNNNNDKGHLRCAWPIKEHDSTRSIQQQNTDQQNRPAHPHWPVHTHTHTHTYTHTHTHRVTHSKSHATRAQWVCSRAENSTMQKRSTAIHTHIHTHTLIDMHTCTQYYIHRKDNN